MAGFSITGPSKENDFNTVVSFFPEYGGGGYARSTHIIQARNQIWNGHIFGNIIFDVTGVEHVTTSTLAETINFLNHDERRTVSSRASEAITQELHEHFNAK